MKKTVVVDAIVVDDVDDGRHSTNLTRQNKNKLSILSKILAALFPISKTWSTLPISAQ